MNASTASRRSEIGAKHLSDLLSLTEGSDGGRLHRRSLPRQPSTPGRRPGRHRTAAEANGFAAPSVFEAVDAGRRGGQPAAFGRVAMPVASRRSRGVPGPGRVDDHHRRGRSSAPSCTSTRATPPGSRGISVKPRCPEVDDREMIDSAVRGSSTAASGIRAHSSSFSTWSSQLGVPRSTSRTRRPSRPMIRSTGSPARKCARSGHATHTVPVDFLSQGHSCRQVLLMVGGRPRRLEAEGSAENLELRHRTVLRQSSRRDGEGRGQHRFRDEVL